MLLILNSVFSAVVLWAAVCAVNRMTRKTNFWIRITYIVLGTGAFSALITPLLSTSPQLQQPSIPTLLLMMAFTSMAVWDRRKAICRGQHVN